LVKVFLQEITNEHCRFSKYFPRKDVKADGILGVCKSYLDELLCISKLCLEDHLEKLEDVLRQICNAGLKVNAAKSTFCALEIEYLGYLLTKDGIKPQSSNVQTILAIEPPTGVKQLRHLILRHGAILP
jgi:hypothetical protein